MGLLDSVNASVRVKVAGLPEVPVPLSSSGGEPPLLLRLLRPRVRIYAGNVLLEQVQPAGDPELGPPWAVLVLLAAVTGLVLLGRATA